MGVHSGGYSLETHQASSLGLGKIKQKFNCFDHRNFNLNSHKELLEAIKESTTIKKSHERNNRSVANGNLRTNLPEVGRQCQLNLFYDQLILKQKIIRLTCLLFLPFILLYLGTQNLPILYLSQFPYLSEKTIGP